jgi:uncharacterized membrane protein
LWLAVGLAPQATGLDGVAQAAVLGILIAAGAAIYGLLLLLFRVIDRAEMCSALTRSRSGDLRA